MAAAQQCPACGGPAADTPLVVREMMFGRDEKFAYLECSDCATLWLRDVPDDLGAYYPRDYYSVDVDPEVALGRPGVRQFATVVGRSVLFGRRLVAGSAGRVVRMKQFHSFLTALDSLAAAGLPHGRDSRVLDVGCGSGVLVYALGLAGVRTALGVDPFAPADRRMDSGASIVRRDLGEVDGTFDLVMFHHSFEHVPDPSASLLQARERLAPGGRILVRMPTVSSAAFDEYGADWVQLDAPRHLSVFSRAGMDRLATRHGLRVVGVHDDSSAFQFWGSEQVRRGIALMDPSSMAVSPRGHAFTAPQVAAWRRRTAELNRAGRGDQAAWVLEPA